MTTRAIAVTTCVLAFAVAPAEASCVPSSAQQRLQRADAVFVGRVVSVSANGASASFRVLSVRKGDVSRGASVRIHARPYPSSVTIGWQPRAGQRWRVYVDRSGRRWITNDCMAAAAYSDRKSAAMRREQPAARPTAEPWPGRSWPSGRRNG